MPSPARVGRLLGFALPAAFSVGMFLQFGRCLPVGTSHSDAAGADEGTSGERSRKASTRVQAKMGRARWGCAESGALLQGRDALVFAAEPVFAGLFGYLLAGDRLGAMGWAGCALILTGIVVSEPGAAKTLRRLALSGEARAEA